MLRTQVMKPLKVVVLDRDTGHFSERRARARGKSERTLCSEADPVLSWLGKET